MKLLLVLLVMLCLSPGLRAEDESSVLTDALTAYRAGDYTAARALFEAELAKNPRSQAARTHLKLIDQKLARSAALKRTLDGILLPRFELRDVTTREAFDYAAALINKQAGEGFRLNMVWMVPADHQGSVTLTLDNVPASTALEYLAAQAGFQLVFDEFAVKVSLPKS